MKEMQNEEYYQDLEETHFKTKVIKLIYKLSEKMQEIEEQGQS